MPCDDRIGRRLKPVTCTSCLPVIDRGSMAKAASDLHVSTGPIGRPFPTWRTVSACYWIGIRAASSDDVWASQQAWPRVLNE